MRMFFLLALCTLLIWTCRKEEAYPTIDIPAYDIVSVVQNEIDSNRICIAQLLSKLIGDEDFRTYFREQSINENENWNNEFLLITHLDELAYDGLTVIELIERVIVSHSDLCIGSVAEFEQKLLDDPLLVLKLPDVIPAENWDAIRTIPFLYTQTIQLANSPELGPYQAILGIHPSGAVDTYLNGASTYFPMVLKHSEDYIAINEALTLFNGTPLRLYHTTIPNAVYGAPFFDALPQIGETEWRIIHLNEMIQHINEAREEEYEIYELDNCEEDCIYECVPEAERKLIATTLGIHSQNENALEYEFSSVYRPSSFLILFDNILPLAITKHWKLDHFSPWNRLLLGSYRMTDLFDVALAHEVAYTSYSIDGKVFELPSLSLSFELRGKHTIALDNLLLAEEIQEGDFFRYSFYRIKMDLPSPMQLAIDNEVLSAFDIENDGVLNSGLYCIPEEKRMGANSIALWCEL